MTEVSAPVSNVSAPSSAPSAAPSNAAPSSSTPSTSASQTQNTPTGLNLTEGQTSDTNGLDLAGQDANAAQKKMYKVMIDGAESEVTEEQLLRDYQTAKASAKRFEEGNRLRGQAERFVEQLRADPLSILQHPSLGIDFPALAEQFMYEKIQNEMLSPEERQVRQERAELERYRASEAERVAREKEMRMNQLRDHYANDYTQKFTTALEQTGLPRTAWTVSRMASYVSQSLQSGYQPDLSEVAKLVHQDFVTEQKALFGSLDGSKLVELLGDDFAKKIRDAEIAKFKGTTAAAAPSQNIPLGNTTPPKATNNMLSREELKRELYRRAGL